MTPAPDGGECESVGCAKAEKGKGGCGLPTLKHLPGRWAATSEDCQRVCTAYGHTCCN